MSRLAVLDNRLFHLGRRRTRVLGCCSATPPKKTLPIDAWKRSSNALTIDRIFTDSGFRQASEARALRVVLRRLAPLDYDARSLEILEKLRMQMNEFGHPREWWRMVAWGTLAVAMSSSVVACEQYDCADLASCPSPTLDGGAQDTASVSVDGLPTGPTTQDDATFTDGASDDGESTTNQNSQDISTATDSSSWTVDDSTAHSGSSGALGKSCSEGAECASGHCVDAVCCESACSGQCAACNVEGQEGQCTAPASDSTCPSAVCPPDTECMHYDAIDTDGTCLGLGECAPTADCVGVPLQPSASCQSGTGLCDGMGECIVPDKIGLGEACEADTDCGSGHCVDSVEGEAICCDGACSGVCQGCGADGHCTTPPNDDASCDEVSCPSDTDCATYPTTLSANRCQSFGSCWTAETYCEPTYASSEAVCTASDRDGECDGAGGCIATVVCGDGITEGDEECDDANQSDTDSCTRECKEPACGDGVVQANRGELCDDGNRVNGDGCSRGCVGGFAPKGSSMVTSVHLCGIRASGTPSCWGLNSSGELGRGSTSSSSLELPSAVLNEDDVVDIAMNGSTTCAVRSTGRVACWGNGFGAYSEELGAITDATQISGGDSRPFCARRANGEVGCWGTDGVVSAQAGLSNIVQVALGNNHSCALVSDGTIQCLGANAAGEGGRSGSLGGTRATSPILASLLEPAVQLAAGYRYTCYISASRDSVQCVGDSQTLGNPSAADGILPVTVLNVSEPEKLASGGQHVCVLEQDGKVSCWGQGAAAGSSTVSETPVEIDLPLPAVDVGAGSQTSCALLEDGSTYCWGAWAPTSQSLTPVLIDL